MTINTYLEKILVAEGLHYFARMGVLLNLLQATNNASANKTIVVINGSLCEL